MGDLTMLSRSGIIVKLLSPSVSKFKQNGNYLVYKVGSGQIAIKRPKRE